ncbi:MAG: anthranilate synthase component I [Polyangiales bacterium]
MQRQLVIDDLTPVGAYAILRSQNGGAPSFLLESAPIGGERWGRYSIIGWKPRRAISLDFLSDTQSVRLRVIDLHNALIRKELVAPRSQAIALLRAHAFETPTDPVLPTAPRVVDSAVGYLAYDLVHALEPVPTFGGDRRLAFLVEGARSLVFDALLQTWTLYAETEAEIDEALEALRSVQPRLSTLTYPDRAETPEGLTTSVDDEAFAAMVVRAQQYIAAGDIFQVVLARTFKTPRKRVDPFDVYRALRVLNPSPYLYFLDFGDRLRRGFDPRCDPRFEQTLEGSPDAIVGASPETLVRLEDGLITLRPLAGTRPRGHDELEDQALERALLLDPKERAEHVMLIDLGRNDVGRVAEVGSVHVPVQMSVERYSHVMHIVSEVKGRLAKGKDAWDLIASAFPAGTLSGAPKVRAMQIIRELEPMPRGVYGGAIGYVSRNGTLDMAIAIRTLVAMPDTFEIGAGAGIVEGSIPAVEAQETRHKAGASLAAVAAVAAVAAAARSST